ncbi:hypothetical protein DBR27_00520, partial [Flavobacterium sp. HMWF030]
TGRFALSVITPEIVLSCAFAPWKHITIRKTNSDSYNSFLIINIGLVWFLIYLIKGSDFLKMSTKTFNCLLLFSSKEFNNN